MVYPHGLLARVINEMALAGSEWKIWSIPAMRLEEAARLEGALVRTDEFEREAWRRSDAACDLKKVLIDGLLPVPGRSMPTPPRPARARPRDEKQEGILRCLRGNSSRSGRCRRP
ncbi:hypothetical protein MLAC_26870 [Mycobacterium lacus]|uniref:Uncharacterized protein n=1 Tax=Mycobacterium lacus TaxID=169765 RepID=A0A7I7NM79_9MYCO|nr:hypothetical protein MLAC_26870 [Mycobacterium lacus]